MKIQFLKSFLIAATLTSSIILTPTALAHDYKIDTDGAHAFIQFKIKHLGYSWLIGRFNKFSGDFSYDEKNTAAAKVTVNIDTSSLDSNHAERDKHLRGKDFLNVKKFPNARFVSKKFTDLGNGKAIIEGALTLHGVTKQVNLAVDYIGQGKDPWGGYRLGFEAKTSITLKDFGINFDLGPASQAVELYLGVEGIRQ